MREFNVAGIRAYAKINLGLLVSEKRPDGYHNIETVFHRIHLYDEVTLSPLDELLVESSSFDAPGDERNICFKAARLLRDYLGVNAGVRIHLQKNIPVGAGLGGGSSDAAVVLRNLPKLWGAEVNESVLQDLALQLGSDVPYFLGKGSAFARGRGELLEYFSLDIPRFILLCNPRIHISTAWAYQHVKPGGREQWIDLKRLIVDGMVRPELLKGIRNDFEPAVFPAHPEVEQVKQVMLECGADLALMSGSGSSVYGLFPLKDQAEHAGGVLKSRGYFISITEPGFNVD